jgi:hypothetical protein
MRFLIFERKTMKIFIIIFSAIILASCGTHTALNQSIRDEFNLSTEQDLRKVQFYTSNLIILEKSASTGNKETGDDGSLVKNSKKEENRVIIPVNTKGVFDGLGANGELKVRFEMGTGKTILFTPKSNNPEGKYYIVADWTDSKGGKLTYGEDTYYAVSTSGQVYLEVMLKKLQKTRRKDRYVKGLKV